MPAETPYKLQVINAIHHTHLSNVYFPLCYEIVTEIVHGIMFILTPGILSVVCFCYYAEYQISKGVQLVKYVDGSWVKFSEAPWYLIQLKLQAVCYAL